MTQWSRKLVNLRQTPEERRLKYFLARHLGAGWWEAQRMRDWRWNKIARRYGYEDFDHLKRVLDKGE